MHGYKPIYPYIPCKKIVKLSVLIIKLLNYTTELHLLEITKTNNLINNGKFCFLPQNHVRHASFLQ